MKYVNDQRLHLQQQQVVSVVVERRVALQLPLQVAFVVLQLAFFNCIYRVIAKLNHLCKAANLRRSVNDVQSFLVGQGLL